MSALGWIGEACPRITRADMEKVARLVYANSGITLRPELKEAMVIARLQKRLRIGSFKTFAEYLRYVERDETGNELRTMLEALATNHTSFLREPEHFTFLADRILPGLIADQTTEQPILGWTAACATGEEAYSILVTLLERVPIAQHGRIRLLASDLSTTALATARNAVYPIERVAHLPEQLRRRYFERGLGAQAGLARVKRSVRQLVEFRCLNLMDIDYLGQSFHFIFCRNAMIYFDRAARQRVVTMLAKQVVPRGYIFLSQCESLSELSHNFKWCAAGVYQRGES